MILKFGFLFDNFGDDNMILVFLIITFIVSWLSLKKRFIGKILNLEPD